MVSDIGHSPPEALRDSHSSSPLTNNCTKHMCETKTHGMLEEPCCVGIFVVFFPIRFYSSVYPFMDTGNGLTTQAAASPAKNMR